MRKFVRNPLNDDAMKKFWMTCLGAGLLVATALSCSDDTPEGGAACKLPVASIAFHATRATIEATEAAAGRTVEGYDAATRTLAVRTGVEEFPSIRYYFDEADTYRYAMVEAASFDLFASEDWARRLGEGNWSAYPDDDAGDEAIYSDGWALLRVFLRESARQATPAMLVGPTDEGALSWTRTVPLVDKATGMQVPLVAFGASHDLVAKYEALQGHPVNTGRTNPSKQFYAYDTGDARYPMIGYWFDVATDTFLEECALYIEPDARPAPAQVHDYLTALGFEETGLKDAEGNFLYYHAPAFTVCSIEMNEPASGVFSPKLRFYVQDLTADLPKAQVDIPWPNVEFGKITLEEAVAWYQAQGYAVATHADLGIPEVTTASEDFPTILLLDEDGLYYGAYVMTPDEKVIYSPDVVRQLTERGFEQVEGSILPTYHNTETDTEAQIDTSAMFGAYAIGFNLIGA